MIDLLTEVRPGTNRYISGKDVLKDLPLYLQPFNKIVIITGEKSWSVFSDFYGVLEFDKFIYDGSASDEDGERLAREIGDVDCVIAIGGGRLIDTAKLACEIIGTQLVIVPTIVSNCAPYAPVIAVYTQDTHAFKRIGVVTKAPYLTLVDWTFLLATPKDYFIAGIGDTLAKWYECEAVTRHSDPNKLKAFQLLALNTAKAILEILLQKSEEAVRSLENQVVTDAFGQVADTIIALAGCVGGFGERYGRVAGAHAIHNGLSLIGSTHSALHGFKVAYGILVQLAYTKDYAEIEKLMSIYNILDLPTRLEALNVDSSDERLINMAEFAASENESFVFLDEFVTSKKILDAVMTLEKITNKSS